MDALQAAATRRRRTVSEMVRIILDEHLEDLEASVAKLDEEPGRYSTDIDIHAAVRAATETAVKEVMDKLRR